MQLGEQQAAELRIYGGLKTAQITTAAIFHVFDYLTHLCIFTVTKISNFKTLTIKLLFPVLENNNIHQVW